MGDKLSAHQMDGSGTLIASYNWGYLRKDFSADMLFRHNYYNLITGRHEITDRIVSKRFVGKIIEYAGSNYDINLLPALKKISDDNRYDGSIRARATAVRETLENYSRIDGLWKVFSPVAEHEEKIFSARIILAGTRLPQTTEILRLLREKHIEIKRISLYIIGKFRLTDFLKEVCDCLSIRGLENDAFTVLHSFGKEASGELRNYYLKVSGNVNTGKLILLLLAEFPSPGNINFIYSRLWSNSRKIREISLQLLANAGFKAPETDIPRLERYVYEIAGLLTWIVSMIVCLKKNNRDASHAVMVREYLRWRKFLFNLLEIGSFGRAVNEIPHGVTDEKEPGLRVISEIRKILFKTTAITDRTGTDGQLYDRKLLRKLNRYFPFETTHIDQVYDEIINADYNRISVWSKACTLRDIPELKEERLIQSVIALLFSPERTLREEAWRLAERSEAGIRELLKERIRNLPDRPPEGSVMESQGSMTLIFDKTVFMSSCFPGIPEEELLILAEKIIVSGDPEREAAYTGNGFIMWSFDREKSVTAITVKTRGNIIKEAVSSPVDGFVYLLPLQAIEEFFIQFPERSLQIAEYIDNHEE